VTLTVRQQQKRASSRYTSSSSHCLGSESCPLIPIARSLLTLKDCDSADSNGWFVLDVDSLDGIALPW
jgi:hypothetical protein